jgi:hypothetical protein
MEGVFSKHNGRRKPSIKDKQLDQKIASIPQRNPAQRALMKANHDSSTNRSGWQRVA